MAEIIKKMTDELKTEIIKEGTEPDVKFRVKTLLKSDNRVVEETVLNPSEFLAMYQQFLQQEFQLKQQLYGLEKQLTDKVWEKWPETVKTNRATLTGMEKIKKDSYDENFKVCQKIIAPMQVDQMLRGLPRMIENLEKERK